MSTYVLSDIHGCGKQYHEMLELIGLSDEDKLYIIGDVIDRGPDGTELLREIAADSRVNLIMGNHEFMMLETVLDNNPRSWELNHCEPTIAGLNKLNAKEFEDLIRFTVNLPYNIDITVGDKTYELVHACPWELCRCDRFGMVWNRMDAADINVGGGKTVIFGHTPTIMLEETNNKPVILYAANAINIDCGCVYGGRLACLRLDDMKEFFVEGPPFEY